MIKYTTSVKGILIFLGLLYIVLSSLKIHTSSIAAWDYFLGKDYKKSVITGTPQLIRQDEWMINTPNLINLYDYKPLTFSAAAKYILKPKDWPHLFLSKKDHERKFAFSWNLKVFGFLVSTFLVLLLITKNNLLLSITGSLLIFLSTAFQWWSYHIGLHMTSMNMLFLGVIYFMYSDKVLQIVIAAWLMVAGLYTIATEGLYPAWQVPMGYMYIILLIGYLYENRDLALFNNNKKLRLGLALVGLIAVVFGGIEYYQQIYAQSKDMLNTIYPGKRFATGGDLTLSHLFIEYFYWFINPESVPKPWSNICEVSSVIFVLPIVFYCVIEDAFKSRQEFKILLPLLAFNLILLFYMVIGFTPFLSKITLMSFSPGPRTLPIFGISNILLLIKFLSLKKDKGIFELKKFLMVFSFIILYFYLVQHLVSQQTNNFFTSGQFFLSLSAMGLIFLGIKYFTAKHVSIITCTLLILFSIKTLAIHPLTKGLKPIIKNEVTRASLEIKKSDPNSRWAVFGSPRFAALLSPTKVDKINGVVPIPNKKDIAILDPTNSYTNVHNRYAQVALYFDQAIGDEVIFQAPEDKAILDYYTIIIHPCNNKLKKLNVKYLLFTYKPTLEETKCLTLLNDLGGRFIYRIN